MNHPLTLVLGRDDQTLRQQVREIAPAIQIVSAADIKENPRLLSQVEIAYGGLDKDQIVQAMALKWIQNGGAGVDRLLTPELEARNVQITNVSGIHARAITEHVFGMLLSVSRDLKTAHEQQTTHKWKHLGSTVFSLYGKTLGILGVGAIGSQMARVGRAFDMKTIGLRRGAEPHPDIEEMFSPENKLHFFAKSHIVMNVLPFTDATRNFMSDAEFDALPDGAIIANAGRGGTIDTDALLRALKSNKVKWALLDVTQPEPLPANHPLWEMPNVFITPHYSGAHPEYNAEADAIFLDNLRHYVAGEPLNHIVDKNAGY